MKKLLLVLVAIILCLTLVSCSGGGSSDKIQITFMHMWPEHEDAMNKLINNFEKENPDVEVTVSITPSTYMEQVLQSSYISDTLPNVYVFYTHFMTPLVSSSEGVMAGSLNDVYEETKSSYINKDAWELGNLNGTYYSAPFRATAELVFYDKTLFEENEWVKPTTFEEFEALIKAIAKDGNYTPLACGGKDGQITYLVNALSLFCSLLDGSVDEPGYQVGRLEPAEDTTNAELIYEKIQKWYSNNYLGKGAAAVSKTGAVKSFTSKKAAMVFANVCNVGEITELMEGREIDLFAIPAPAVLNEQMAQAGKGEVKYVYGGYDGLSYNPNASEEEIEASKRLIKYLVSDAAQQVLADQTQSIIVNKNVTYHDETFARFAAECSHVGDYSHGVDYLTGSNSAKSSSIVTTYISGTSGKTAKQIIDMINDNLYKDLQDTLLNNPKKEWYKRVNPVKTFDNTWLK